MLKSAFGTKTSNCFEKYFKPINEFDDQDI